MSEANYALEPTSERRKRGQGLMKQTLSAEDAPLIARYRARAPFTLLCARQQIMEDAKSKPIEKRERSLRRRLTPFDRALTEDQAVIIDKLVRAHLAFYCCKGSGWTQGVDSSATPSLPFKAREHKLLKLYGHVNMHLAPVHKRILNDLNMRMLPDYEPEIPVDYQWISSAKLMAEAALEIVKKKFEN